MIEKEQFKMSDNERNIRTWKAMGQRAIQLCVELREQLMAYCKQENKGKRDLLLMDLMRRCECNLFAVFSLAKVSLENEGTTYLKLPVGLLLRSCFSDCIMGLFISTLSDADVEQLAQTLNEEYVASLFNRAEVYKDKVREFLPFDDKTLDGWYTTQLEDHFINYLVSNPQEENINVCTFWRVEKTGMHVTLQKMVKALQKNEELNRIGTQLFAYYKYFSQYEHFSEAAHGDTIVDFGMDNVSYEKAVETLRNGLYNLKN